MGGGCGGGGGGGYLEPQALVPVQAQSPPQKLMLQQKIAVTTRILEAFFRIFFPKSTRQPFLRDSEDCFSALVSPIPYNLARYKQGGRLHVGTLQQDGPLLICMCLAFLLLLPSTRRRDPHIGRSTPPELVLRYKPACQMHMQCNNAGGGC